MMDEAEAEEDMGWEPLTVGAQNRVIIPPRMLEGCKEGDMVLVKVKPKYVGGKWI